MRDQEKTIINKYLGIPFKHRGRSMDALDCYGLVKNVYQDLGYELFDIEDYEEKWFENGKNHFIENHYRQWKKVSHHKPFDVVLFKRKGVVSHCGVVLSDWKFLHCSHKTKGVVVSRLRDKCWDYCIEGFYRLKERI
jgi:cell wall-associated NlpC family hydrolase